MLVSFTHTHTHAQTSLSSTYRCANNSANDSVPGGRVGTQPLLAPCFQRVLPINEAQQLFNMHVCKMHKELPVWI